MKTKTIVPINLDWPAVKPIDYRKYITPIQDTLKSDCYC